MKVEFLDSELLGPELFVSATDFLKAKNNDTEFDSLLHATQAFAGLFGIEYEISEKEYDAVAGALEKNGAAIFTVGTSRYPDRRWIEISVSNNNQLSRVVYEDEEGYHCVIRGKFNPKAAAAIKKRNEGGRK